jgi:hypothetical protein
MCDFHSTVWRMLGDSIEMLHDPSNSHSEMIQVAKWRTNEPNRKVTVFEAEWDGQGDIPSDSRLIRNNGECPERLVSRIRSHYVKLKEAIETGKHLDGYFSDLAKYGDVWAHVKKLPDNVTFPEKMSGSLDLSSLKTLPDNVTFPKECGYLYLSSDLKRKIKR